MSEIDDLRAKTCEICHGELRANGQCDLSASVLCGSAACYRLGYTRLRSSLAAAEARAEEWKRKATDGRAQLKMVEEDRDKYFAEREEARADARSWQQHEPEELTGLKKALVDEHAAREKAEAALAEARAGVAKAVQEAVLAERERLKADVEQGQRNHTALRRHCYELQDQVQLLRSERARYLQFLKDREGEACGVAGCPLLGAHQHDTAARTLCDSVSYAGSSPASCVLERGHEGPHRQGSQSWNDLKILPAYFRAQAEGLKTFELRRNDRDYQVGDVLELREWVHKARPCYPCFCKKMMIPNPTSGVQGFDGVVHRHDACVYVGNPDKAPVNECNLCPKCDRTFAGCICDPAPLLEKQQQQPTQAGRVAHDYDGWPHRGEDHPQWSGRDCPACHPARTTTTQADPPHKEEAHADHEGTSKRS